MIINSKVYDVMKYITMVVLPAVTTLCFLFFKVQIIEFGSHVIHHAVRP